MRCQASRRQRVNHVLLRRCVCFIISCLLLFKGVALAESALDFYRLLPAGMDAWKKTGPPEVFDNKTLFQYIDGGAELYISYGFKKLTAFGYVRGKDEEIRVDVFDMGNSCNAFGVFSLGRESLSTEFGQGSEYSSGFLNFWKDRYYVSLTGYPESDEKRRLLVKLGAAIARGITKEGPLPPILSAVPPDGLIAESLRYARHYIWLNNHHFISNENILLIDPQTEAVLARYNRPDGKHVLVLIKYSDAQKAQKAEASFLKNYMPEASSGIKQQENGRFAGVARRGAGLAVVLDAPDKKTAENVLAQAIKKCN